MSTPTLADVERLDAEDPLAPMRCLFHLRDGLVYLDGNSLGPPPRAAFAEIDRAVHEEWANGLITSWNKAGWFMLTDTLGAQVARLVGARAHELVVCDTTSVNIFKALHAGLSLRPGRRVIVAEGGSFPTDLYIAEGVARSAPGIALRLEGVDGARIEDLIDETVAVVLANQVDYRTGALRDMAALTARAHAAGAVIVWDLCHSAGVMQVDLNGAEADLAVGCTYKYLNGGPGAPAFVFCAERHLAGVRQPLSGWWGHRAPFAFDRAYEAAPGIRKFLCGTQPVLSLRALAASLDLFDGVDMGAVRAKSMALTDLFIGLVEARCAGHGLRLASPREASSRGSQVAFAHEHGYAVMQALIARDVIGDFRAPDIMRFGFAPLYIGYRDVWNAVETLRDILDSGTWRETRFAERAAVT
jgi:kynureninase